MTVVVTCGVVLAGRSQAIDQVSRCNKTKHGRNAGDERVCIRWLRDGIRRGVVALDDQRCGLECG
jgi:hypothetical protein